MKGREIDTDPLLKHCFADGKKVYLPRVVRRDNSEEMVMLETASFDEIYDADKFTESKWGIREPMLDGERQDAMHALHLDLILVPGVAFNAKLCRLGHGKGFYDRYFTKYRAALPSDRRFPHLIGIGLSANQCDDIPVEAHDWMLDQVILPNP